MEQGKPISEVCAVDPAFRDAAVGPQAGAAMRLPSNFGEAPR
jgi:hypothetical protein